VFCSEGTFAGTGCKTLACALAVMILWHRSLTANGSLSNYLLGVTEKEFI